jgi:hypothetical protein
MSSGGKGGEQKTEIDPDVKRVMMDMAARGKQISQLPKLNYQGLTMAAPSAATEHYANARNAQANLLGVGMEGSPLDGLPEAKEMNGMRGYSAYDLYKDDIARQDPSKLAAYNAITPGQFEMPTTGGNGQYPGVPNIPGAPNIDWEMIQRLYGVRMP